MNEYEDLKRELSHISRRSSIPANKLEKLEEGEAVADEFNLSDFLHGMSNDSKEAGHQPKHLGVIWKSLSVEVKKKN